MKFELRYRDDWRNGDWRKQWNFEFEAQRVFASSNTIHIKIVASYGDNSITLHLNKIPARIDLQDDGSAWLLDEEDVHFYPDPYKSSASDKSQTIYRHGEREETNLVEVGEASDYSPGLKSGASTD